MIIEIILGDSVASIDIVQVQGPEGPQGKGLLDYSATEQDTGLKWIDGKTIYQKTVGTAGPLANFPGATNLLMNTVGTIERIISMEGAVLSTTAVGDWLMIPTAAREEQDEVEVVYFAFFDRIQISPGSGHFNSLVDFYITVRYTKV